MICFLVIVFVTDQPVPDPDGIPLVAGRTLLEPGEVVPSSFVPLVGESAQGLNPLGIPLVDIGAAQA